MSSIDNRDWIQAPDGTPTQHHASPDEKHMERANVQNTNAPNGNGHIGWRAPPFHHVDSREDDIAIPRSVFEKIYMSPPVDVKGNLRNILANPTPLGLVGFLVATLPTSFQLMQIGGSGGAGSATASLGLYFGGWLQIIVCIMEWILGNTFSFLLFGAFGAAWFVLSSVDASQAAFVQTATGHGMSTEAAVLQFHASFAFGLLTFGLLLLTFTFCALRTNIMMVICFANVSIAIFVMAGSNWAISRGQMDVANNMQVAVGAIFFVSAVLAWYVLVAMLLEVLEFGYTLPVGDLNARWGGLGRTPEYRDRSRSV